MATAKKSPVETPAPAWPNQSMEAERLDAVALIAGAGSGIGAVCARAVAERSDGGLILVDADETALARVADDLEARNASPERMSTLAFDVNDPDGWRRAADFIRTQYGRLDWALVNAGAAQGAPPASTDLVDWGRKTSTDFDGVFLALRAVMPLMRNNLKGGAVVVAASEAALKAAGSRDGLLQFMRVASKEAAPEKVRVNAIAPGSPDMPLLSQAPAFQGLVKEKGGERAAFEAIAQLPAPLARYASSDDIARLIVMLLSDESPITGATLVLDGGYTL